MASPAALAQERELAARMAGARAAEYLAVIAQAAEALSMDSESRAITAARLRAELRRIARRDYFPPAERDRARAAVQELFEPAEAEQIAARQ